MQRNEKTVEVVAVRQNEVGIITDLKLSDGSVVTKNRAITLARKGMISGVNIGRGRDGSECLRGNPTSAPLSQLPTF